MIKIAAYFIVGLLLGAAAVANAETIPATSGAQTFSLQTVGTYTGIQNSYTAACDAGLAYYQGKYPASGFFLKACQVTNSSAGVNQNYGTARFGYGTGGGEYTDYVIVKSAGYSCPSGQNWTLSGANCTRPDCVAPQTRQADGTCTAPCPNYDPGNPDKGPLSAPAGCTCPNGTAWFAYNGCRKTCGTAVNAPIGNGADYYIDKRVANQCAGGCQAFPDGEWMDATDGIHRWVKMSSSGWACSGTTDTATQPDDNNPKLDPGKKKPPVCGASDGVMTTNTGKVLCVPEGTPDARKPDVKVRQKTETFPDNSARTTTETQTTDPATHATDTRSSTSTSTKPDGTEGQAGKAGTSTSTSNVSGTGPGGNGDGDGDGGCDPTLNFCGGPATDGLYTKKEKTLDSVLSSFQSTVKASPVGSASTSFFNVSTPSGGCPAWSVTVPMLNITLDGSSIFCNGTILSAMNAAGAVLLALATYIAFTWAFL